MAFAERAIYDVWLRLFWNHLLLVDGEMRLGPERRDDVRVRKPESR
jgi:hypothetical protein